MADLPLTNKPVMAWVGKRPIYADRPRKLFDIATSSQNQAWHPANIAAKKLFRCLECLRDLEELIQSAGKSKNRVKVRRNLKILHTPLHSLVEATRDLANDLENNPATVSRLPHNARPLISQLRAQLLRISSLEQGGLLSTVRDKISAHIDRELTAEEMHILLKLAEPARIGMWLHACVAVLADFIKLPVYFWFCQPDGENNARILFTEPFIVTMGFDTGGKMNRILDIQMLTHPPRFEITKLLMKVVKNSKWMFGLRAPQIKEFLPDRPNETWAKSLQWLPMISELPAKNCIPSIVKKFSTEQKECLLIPTNVPFFIGRMEHSITDSDALKF